MALIHNVTAKLSSSGRCMTKNEFKEFNENYNEPFQSKENNAASNIILTEKMRISLYALLANANTLVIGGTSDEKRESVILPNLLQAHGSYIVTDPGGQYLKATRNFFEGQGYRICVLNMENLNQSDPYNPFRYIYGEGEAYGVAECIMENIYREKEARDPFWEKTELTLIEACICYLLYHCPEEGRNPESLVQLLGDGLRGQQGETELDKRFREIQSDDSYMACVRLYHNFLKATDDPRIRGIIVNTAIEHLSVFDYAEIKRWNRDGMDLETVGEIKTVVYLIPPKEKDLGILVPLFYYQAYGALLHYAESQGKPLPMEQRVLFLMDRFADYGEIPDFYRTISILRQYGMVCMVFVPSIKLIEAIYGDRWDILCGGTASKICFGCNDGQTLKYLEMITGTYRVNGEPIRKGLSPEEIKEVCGKGNVLCKVARNKPIYDKKFCLENHPNAKFLL